MKINNYILEIQKATCKYLRSSDAYVDSGRWGGSLSRNAQTSLSLVTSSRSSPGPPPGGTPLLGGVRAASEKDAWADSADPYFGTLRRKPNLAALIHDPVPSFGQYPKFTTIGEGGNADRLVNRQLLQMPHRSTCWFCEPNSPYSWTRSWDTWTPPPKGQSSHQPREGKLPV